MAGEKEGNHARGVGGATGWLWQQRPHDKELRLLVWKSCVLAASDLAAARRATGACGQASALIATPPLLVTSTVS